MGCCAPKPRRVVWSPARETELFVYDLDLLVEHLTGEAIDREVYPVMLFPLNHESCKTVSVGRIPPALCDQVDH